MWQGSASPLGCAARTGDEWFAPLRFAGVLGLLLLGAFPKVLLGLHSFVYRDYGVLAYPFIHYARESFWRGELPFWNPLSNCGAPFLAQWGTMTLYPFSLFFLVLPLPWSLGCFCLGHLFLGGMGMYFLARRWTDNTFAASLAGVAFVFNGVTLSCLMWPNYTAALGWMPWVVGLAERGFREGGRRTILAALVATLQILAGVPEIAAFTWLVALGLWAGACWGDRSRWKLILSRLLIVMILVAGLVAIQLLPFLDLLAHSQRDRTFATSKWALPGWGWANLLVPLFHCFQTYQGPFVQQGQAFFSSCYLGAALLGLAAIGAWRARSWRALLLGAIALLGLIAALGESGHLYSWMKQVFPLLGVGRYPVKFMVLVAFAAPLLGAFAIAWWTAVPASEWRIEKRWFLGISFLMLAGMAAILWFAFHYPLPLDQWPATWHNAAWRAAFLIFIIGAVILLPRLAEGRFRVGLGLAILLGMTLDITTHTPNFNPTIAASEFEPRLWQRYSSLAPPVAGRARVMISPPAEKLLLSSTETNLARDFLAKRLALWSNLNLLDGIAKVNGSATLQLREEHQIETLLYGNPGRAANGLMDFLAVSEVTAPDQALEWSSRSNFCPLVTCGQKPVFAAPADALDALAAPDFDPLKTVYLPVESQPSVTVSNRTEARIVQTHFSAHRVEIEVEAAAPAMVVVAQTFYHPWRASIEGRPTRLLRANHAFQAVEAPAGHSLIVLQYRDGRFLLGAIISALSFVGCVVGWMRTWGRIAISPRLEGLSAPSVASRR